MILLTGATGFLGKYILEACLAAGLEVRVLVRNASTRELPWAGAVEIIEGDVLDVLALEQATEGVELVIHAAALVSFWPKLAKEVREVNIEGTANVVNACLAANARLIHISSIAGIGRAGKGKVSTEETPVLLSQANSTYARSKMKAEMEIHRGIAEGLSAVMLNPGVILGAGNWTTGTPKIFATLAKGLRYYLPGMAALVAAKDVAKACLLLTDSGIANGERFILVAENWSYQKFLQTAAQALGTIPPQQKIPKTVARIAGWLAQQMARLGSKEPMITLESMRSATQHHTYDGRKIEQLGFAYQPIPELIAEVATAYRSEFPA